MLCPERKSTPTRGTWPSEDQWHAMLDGSRTCSFCGSLHPDDFVDIIYLYIEQDGSRFELTSKGYKVYASRPGVRNASEGGIKFYMWHLPEDPIERAPVDAAWRLVLPVYGARYDEFIKGLRGPLGASTGAET